MLGIVVKNMLGYDILIVMIACVNGFFIFPRAKAAAKALRKELQPRIYTPVSLLLQDIGAGSKAPFDLNQLEALREDALKYYSLFTTINSAFPMFGMLGTILSLLGMVNLDQQAVTLNFTVALTSTFWGLIFALLFKAVDATLAPIVSQNEGHVMTLFERLDRRTVAQDSARSSVQDSDTAFLSESRHD